MGLPDKDIADIKVLFEKWTGFALDADWDNFAGLLTDDFTAMPPDQPVIEGKQAAMAWLREFPSVKEFTHPSVRVEGREDFACVTGTVNMTLEPGPGKTVSMKGKWVCTCRKQADGSWLVASDIWNNDAPLAGG